MKRKRIEEDISSSEEENSDFDDEDEEHSDDDFKLYGGEIHPYDTYKDKLFGDTDDIAGDCYVVLENFDDMSDGNNEDENYYPTELTRRLDALLTSIGTGADQFCFGDDPKDRSDMLRIIIEKGNGPSECPFSVYIMKDKVKEPRKKNSESNLEYFKRCTTKYDADIIDFLTRCNNRYNLFDLYYGNIIFTSRNMDYDEEDEEDEEEDELPRIIDLYHAETGKLFCKQLLVRKKGDIFSEHDFGSGRLLTKPGDKIEITAGLCLVIVPKRANMTNYKL